MEGSDAVNLFISYCLKFAIKPWRNPGFFNVNDDAVQRGKFL